MIRKNVELLFLKMQEIEAKINNNGNNQQQDNIMYNNSRS